MEKEKYDQLMQKYQDQLKNKDSEAKLQVCSQVFFVSLNNNLKHIKGCFNEGLLFLNFLIN